MCFVSQKISSNIFNDHDYREMTTDHDNREVLLVSCERDARKLLQSLDMTFRIARSFLEHPDQNVIIAAAGAVLTKHSSWNIKGLCNQFSCNFMYIYFKARSFLSE